MALSTRLSLSTQCETCFRGSKLVPVTKLLRGSRNPTTHRCTWYSRHHICYIFGPIMPNYITNPKTLLVDSGYLKSYMKFHQDCPILMKIHIYEFWRPLATSWALEIWVLGMFRWFGIIGPKRDQKWAWLYHWHRWAVGVWDPLKISVKCPSLLGKCYLGNKFHKKFRLHRVIVYFACVVLNLTMIEK